MTISTINQSSLAKPLGVGGISTPVHDLHVLRADGASGTLSLSGVTTTGGPSYVIMGNNDSAGVGGPNVIVSANRTLQFGVGNSFTAAGGGTFNPYLSINASGDITANYGSNLYTPGITWQSSRLSGGFSASGAGVVFNLYSLLGRGGGIIRVHGTENGLNNTYVEYSYINAFFGPSATYYGRIIARNRTSINNGYGDPYLYFSNFAGSYTTADQTNSGTALSSMDIYLKNAVNNYGAYAISFQPYNSGV
jgi:hypothetical protein